MEAQERKSQGHSEPGALTSGTEHAGEPAEFVQAQIHQAGHSGHFLVRIVLLRLGSLGCQGLDEAIPSCAAQPLRAIPAMA